VGAFDTSAYPVVRVPLRLMHGTALEQLIDASRVLLTEEGTRRPARVECRARRIVSAAVAIGLERSLDNEFGAAKTAAGQFLRRLRFTDLQDAASLWAFATIIDHPVRMGRDSLSMEAEFSAVSVASFPFNGTPLYETLYRAVDEAASRADVANRAVVFFTDGVNNTAYFNTTLDEVQRRAIAAGVRVYAVTVGDKPQGVAAMRQLCEASGGFQIAAAEPRSIDSVAGALHLEPIDAYWCSCSFESPLCPNGTWRTVAIRVASATGDTAVAETGYQAPLREELLAPAPWWTSPTRVASRPGDTIWIALGYTAPDTATIRRCTVLLRHDGMMRIDGERALPSATGWSFALAGDAATLVAIDPGKAAIPAGEHAVLRIPCVVYTAAPVACSIELMREVSDCVALTGAAAARGVVLRGDTVFGERSRTVDLPVTLRVSDLPEGLQRVSLHCRIPSAAARFNDLPAFIPDSRWTGAVVDTLRVVADAGDTALTVTCHGPPIDELPTVGTLRISVDARAPYEIPVRLDASSVNGFAATPVEDRQGLVVLRDSCRNNLMAVNGLFLSSPAPHPAADHCGFEVIVDRDMVVDLRLLDLQGTVVARRDAVGLHRGRNAVDIPVAGLAPGFYFLHADTPTDHVRRAIIIDR
jgi:hypothetical protein